MEHTSDIEQLQKLQLEIHKIDMQERLEILSKLGKLFDDNN
jgi:hypothetical protein